MREYQKPSEGNELSPAQMDQLRRDVDSKKAQLEQWCKVSFGEVRGEEPAVLRGEGRDRREKKGGWRTMPRAKGGGGGTRQREESLMIIIVA